MSSAMALGLPLLLPPSVPVSRFPRSSLILPLLLVLVLSSATTGQTVIARGFYPFGPADSVAAGGAIETLQVKSQGECAARALFHNSVGFNLERRPDTAGQRTCQITNTTTGCFTYNWETRVGWDYYFSGHAGQGERRGSRTGGHTIDTYVSQPSSFPPTLSLKDPHYRWGIDCNGNINSPEKECSRFLLTGIYNSYYVLYDLDNVRCFTYGAEFRVSQQEASVVAVPLSAGGSPLNQCPTNQVVTAVSDNSAWYDSVEWMKCNLLLGNWRVNYDDCRTSDPRYSGGGSTGWDSNWNVGTPSDQVFAVVGMWRDGTLYTGFKTCRLYRLA